MLESNSGALQPHRSVSRLLAFDSGAGIVAGLITLGLSPWISEWFGWTLGFTHYMGAVNVGYGCYSGILWRLLRSGKLTAGPVTFLVVANSAWAGHCFAQSYWLFDSASWLGLGQLILEGLFVGVLAYIEAMVLLVSNSGKFRAGS